ncbi:hypothetical protein ILUMI_04016 [Ignelater luminosus]|uniref:DUF4371 domain-containing protein n=1 Tax=Ignelater luminosus TaxID=2038154 RepID=A0A8K0DDL6_IGNLU|nr:hypothetical protein ILUMI_04016 [Ignelater luminosus]
MKLGPRGARYAVAEKTLAASFEISKLIAKSQKAHTFGESLIKPCMLKAAEELLEQEAPKKMREIPPSNDTVKGVTIFSRAGNDTQDTYVMDVISQYFKKHGLMWQKLAGFCKDGAPAMLGFRSGLAALIKKNNPLCYSSTSIGCQNAPGMLCY